MIARSDHFVVGDMPRRGTRPRPSWLRVEAIEGEMFVRRIALFVVVAFTGLALSCKEPEEPLATSTSSSGTIVTEDGVPYRFIYYKFRHGQEYRPGPMALWHKSAKMNPVLGIGIKEGSYVEFENTGEWYQIGSTAVVLVRSPETQPEVLADTWDPRVADTHEGFSQFVTRLLEKPKNDSNRSPE